MSVTNRQPADAATLSRRFEAFQRFRRILETATSTNEATTRLRAIDTMIFDVLEWPKGDVETEKFSKPGYADYALNVGDSVAIVLEAKKDDIDFVVPERRYGNAAIGFALLAKECPDACAALRQAAAYANEHGARYVAISNGRQWLLALTHVHGQPISDRSVIVFESLDGIAQRFAEFNDAFALESIAANRAHEILLEPRLVPAPSKLSTRIAGYPLPASRNKVANELSYITNLVWEGVGTEEASTEFLQECYVSPAGTVDALRVAEELLETAHRRQLDGGAATEPSELAARIIRKGEQVEKPIIVLGRIGHGKTTFLRYLRSVYARDALKSYVQLDVDFLDRPDSAGAVPAFLYAQIAEQIRVRYGIDVDSNGTARSALRPELARYRKTPRGEAYAHDTAEFREAEISYIESLMSDRHSYLGAVLQHIRLGQQKSVAVFLDNLDRRPPEMQEAAFLKASALARDWRCPVFICLRPDTYHKSRSRGVLDSVVPRTIVVDAPDPAVMLKKRLQFAIDIASGKHAASHGSAYGGGKSSVAMDLVGATRFLECCRDSFWRNTRLTQLFSAVANRSARVVLDAVKEFLVSDHLNTRKILERLDRNEGYTIPVHEAERALLFGDYLHYDPGRSRFMNLFDVRHSDPREHFMALLALTHLSRADEGESRAFVPKDDLFQYLGALGFTAGVIETAIRRLLDGACLEEADSDAIRESATRIRISDRGRYLLFELGRRFVYLDAVVVDTPIVLQQFATQLHECHAIADRLIRARTFLSYLDECAAELGDDTARQIWFEYSRAIRNSIDEVRP